ncbi:ATP-binding protein [Poseidonocella sp. HB161398]|uniref:ATP-binding protein n=1 Tax=Poseidonocella sp. HB161398 TaxID=2320855 RepID=UPI001485FEC8|nr:ATP-binding protein [Poseidonocella sp. HB161398]
MAASDGAEPQLRLSFPAGPEEVRAALLCLRRDLPRLGLDAAEIFRAELLLAELLNNIVEHAYCAERPGPGAGAIELDCRRKGSALIVTLRDRGRPMPGGGLPEKGLAALDVGRQDLPEGGFGLHLVRELADELSYARRDGTNILRVGLGLGRPPAEA